MANPRGWKSVIEGSALEVVAWLGNDVVIAVSTAAPTDGTSGTLAGQAGPGSLLVDVASKELLINTGTQASPTWTVVGTQS